MFKPEKSSAAPSAAALASHKTGAIVRYRSTSVKWETRGITLREIANQPSRTAPSGRGSEAAPCLYGHWQSRDRRERLGPRQPADEILRLIRTPRPLPLRLLGIRT